MPQPPRVSKTQSSTFDYNDLDPDDFTTVIDNPYFPLRPGTTFISKSADGSTVNTFVVTRQTKVVDGVKCVVVMDTQTVDGEVVEKTFDYFAQDENGNVWYFGEYTTDFENGQVVGHEGSWLAGVDGARPGIIMLASPRVGDRYNQENAPDVAEDMARVKSLNETVATPYGSFDQVLKTADTTPLEPGLLEHKFYAAGVGHLYTVDKNTGEVQQLEKILVEGTSRGDTVLGYAGADELKGYGGGDLLFGDRGADLMTGGRGSDIFQYTNVLESRPTASDRVTDFVAGTDRFDFAQIDAKKQSGFSGNQDFLWGGLNSGVVANSITYFYNAANNTVIQGDVNGDSQADLRIEAPAG